ncbi:hypothetical protein [Methylobacterium oryzihabitans]|uniref:hypothetical protein n=1 Tax=Methylobacterium oryzihabitans TaxID=2499852 RepID=UPI001FEC6CED|nr:hypothetical protein [Methylobacterium oryzihabitans]
MTPHHPRFPYFGSDLPHPEPDPDPARPSVARAWDVVLRWARVLWVCRVSAASVALAFVLFRKAAPARDLFMEFGRQPAYWVAFFGLVLLWAGIVHFAARKVLAQQAWAAPGQRLPLPDRVRERLQDRYRLASAWVPRLLGLGCLGTVWVGITGARGDLGPAQDILGQPDPGWLLWLLAGATLVYCAYVFLRLRFLDAETRYESWLDYWDDFRFGSRSSLLSDATPLWFLEERQTETRRLLALGTYPRGDVFAFACLTALAAVWLWSVARPDHVAAAFPRALLVPVILALPLSVLAYLSTWSHYLRLPLLGLLLLACAVLSGLTPQFHALRPVDGAASVQRADLRGALDAWTRANCPGGGECRADPVILASAGGASRAAFFTASVVGDMLDASQPALRTRLFAISGVSGGAVGAAMIRAALDDAGPDGAPPCREAPSTLFGHGTERGPMTWKTCLQGLASGDFLSRPVIGLVFRDLFGFALQALGAGDRAVLLEQAFEDQYRRVVPARDGAAEGGLARPLGRFPGKEARWSPLLLLNTTSTLDGRRAILSDLLPFWCEGAREERIFPAAIDVHETLGTPHGCDGGAPPTAARRPERAFRLSTAATASARFPVLSPPALVYRPGIPDPDKAGPYDMLVDGGYFENDGLTTAAELARAIEAVRPDLKPVILHVTNNPTSESVRVSGAGQPVPERSLMAVDWYAVPAAPLRTLYATRDGHAAEATLATGERAFSLSVDDQLPTPGAAGCALAAPAPEPRRAPGIKELSMSWWLSGSVQDYLSRQICTAGNVREFQRYLGTVR